MKKFRFKFSVLLEFRRRLESQALVVFSEKQKIYQGELQNKINLQNELQMTLEKREKLGIQPISAIEFRWHNEYIQGLKQKLIQSDQVILRTHRELDKALRRYLDTRKRTKTIELLEEKERGEFHKEISKKNQKELDELIITKYQNREEAL